MTASCITNSIATNTELSELLLDFAGYKNIRDVDKPTCEEICLDDAECVALEFRNSTSIICSFFKGDVYDSVADRKGSRLVIFLSQLATNKKVLSLSSAAFQGYSFKVLRAVNQDTCRQRCEDTIECDAYSWGWSVCNMFSAQDITNIVPSPRSTIKFVQKNT